MMMQYKAMMVDEVLNALFCAFLVHQYSTSSSVAMGVVRAKKQMDTYPSCHRPENLAHSFAASPVVVGFEHTYVPGT
jgi:hypothetical protein